ncbi:conserved hypothetical protein [Candidatus Terasakiella magnetica]|nr:conserved hypothetical protein [Candidatus Terasakiella magnetica]
MTTDETVIAGKTTLTRSVYGDVSFIDAKGERVVLHGPDASRLFETIRDGSGELQEIVRKDGWQPATNLFTNGKRNSFADNVSGAYAL